MPVTPDDVRHVAALARLGLAEQSIDALVGDLNGILAHMDELSVVDTKHVSPHGLSAQPASRPDAGPPESLGRPIESFAPSMRGGFFLVPRLSTHEDTRDDSP